MAEEEDKDSKTEEPSERKLEKAREHGQVAQSQEIKSLAILLGALAIVALMTPSILSGFKAMLGGLLRNSHHIDLHGDGYRALFLDVILEAGALLALPIGLIYALLLAVGFAQVGVLFTPKKLAPKLSNISLIAGFKRTFSANQVMEFLKSVLKLALVAVLLGFLVAPQLPHPEVFVKLDFAATLKELRWLLILVLLGAIFGFAGLAVADWAWQNHRHREQLKMSKKEVKDEHKDTEGNPEIKGKIRQLRSMRARERMMSNVPEASVVITNPTHYAVALKYDMDTMAAPKLVAKGRDVVALRIRDVARDNRVPIVDNPPLARALHASVELEEDVPPQHYKAVAEVIGYVMRFRTARGQVPARPREGWREDAGETAS